MKYFQSWQDFMRDPDNKALKESKGIHACKQKYIQEQNKMMWHDPIILQENGDAGESVPAQAAAAAGNSTSYITGNAAEVSTVTFPLTLDTDKPLKIYYKPSINFKAQGKILALFKQNKDEEAVCMSLIIRALDEHGKNIFNEGNMPNLLHEVDPDVVNRILAEMGANDEDSEEIKKN